jgi:hypothetical protein
MGEDEPEKVLVERDVVKLADSFIGLVRSLDELNRKLDEGRPEIDVCLDAVVAVKRFLGDYNVTRPFGILAAALRDVKLGANPSLFKMAEKKGNRPAGTTFGTAMQATAAAGLELLHRHVKLDEAASFVVKQLDKAGLTHTSDGRPITPETVKGWRDEMGGRNTKESQDTYEQICEDAAALGLTATVEGVQRAIIGSIQELLNEGIKGRTKKSD